MMFMVYIPSESVSHKKHFPTEAEYFTKDIEKLSRFYCPNCKEKGFLFNTTLYIGCIECFHYNTLGEVIDYNAEIGNL